jgi:hypothetical protein
MDKSVLALIKYLKDTGCNKITDKNACTCNLEVFPLCYNSKMLNCFGVLAESSEVAIFRRPLREVLLEMVERESI